MQLQSAILCSCGLLLLGFLLRVRWRLLHRLFVPASVVGGLAGLILIQAAQRVPSLSEPVTSLATTLRSWPSPLIAVVFAGLLIERSQRRLREAMSSALLAGIMVWVIVLGQIALGLLATWLFVLPSYDVPAAFGQLLEAGFAGGHGTATALGTIYRDLLDFPEGLDLGLFIATVGLIYSILSGLVLVNIAVRRGWTRFGRVELPRIAGLENRRDPVPMALARVRPEVIDPLVFQICLLAVAFLIGVGLRYGFILAARALNLGESIRFLENVPLFLFTLLGGWSLRSGMSAMRIDDLIDDLSIKRLVAVAMEFLIVAAIASLRIEVVAAYLGPVAILCGMGFVWTAFCLLVLSRHVLPREHWFELGIINYGMSTGTTAQGMMLLRIIDKDLDSGAAEDYALAAPLSAPFIGGGLLTISLPLILAWVGVPTMIALLTVLTVALFFLGWRLNTARTAAKLVGTAPVQR